MRKAGFSLPVTVLLGFSFLFASGVFLAHAGQNFRQLLVTSAQDDGQGTLRSAIEHANEQSEMIRITFSAEVREKGIDILSDLPAIDVPMSIVGSDIEGHYLSLRFADDPAITDGLKVQAPGVLIVRLHLSGYRDNGIVVESANDVSIISNVIGGEQKFHSQSGSGIRIAMSENVLVDDNQISGHGASGIVVSNIVACMAIADDNDIQLRTPQQVAESYECREKAIQAETFGHHRFTRNTIGMISEEGWASGNKGMGISLEHSSNNMIGGAGGLGNLISNNGVYGVMIAGQASTANVIQGNKVGTDADGRLAKPNGRTGVLIFNSDGNTVGGQLHDTGNLISGNKRHGVNLDGSSTRPNFNAPLGGCGFNQSNVVIGNLIGTDITGSAPLPNGKHGVILFHARNNQVGGEEQGEGNVISANAENGVFVVGPNLKVADWRYFVRVPDTGELLRTNIRCIAEKRSNEVDMNTIIGNTIGMSADRDTFLPNGNNAITLSNSFQNTVVENHLASVKRTTITSRKSNGSKTNILTGNVDYFQSNKN